MISKYNNILKEQGKEQIQSKMQPPIKTYTSEEYKLYQKFLLLIGESEMPN